MAEPAPEQVLLVQPPASAVQWSAPAHQQVPGWLAALRQALARQVGQLEQLQVVQQLVARQLAARQLGPLQVLLLQPGPLQVPLQVHVAPAAAVRQPVQAQLPAVLRRLPRLLPLRRVSAGSVTAIL